MGLKQKPGPRKGAASICYQATTPTPRGSEVLLTAHEEVKSSCTRSQYTTWKRTAAPFSPPPAPSSWTWSCRTATRAQNPADAQAVAAGLRDAKALSHTRPEPFPGQGLRIRMGTRSVTTSLFSAILTGRQAMPADSQTVALFPRPATWLRRGSRWPPSIWPGPPSPTPMPPRNLAGNLPQPPDSPQAIVFLTSIIDETVGIATSYMHYWAIYRCAPASGHTSAWRSARKPGSMAFRPDF